MAGYGYIHLHRQIWDNWIWKDAEPLYFKWWMDLIMIACFKQNKVLVHGRLIVMNTGEYNTSEDKLAVRWNTNRKKVHKFLSLLESDRMITIKKSKRFGSTISICNYALYQNQPVSVSEEIVEVHLNEELSMGQLMGQPRGQPMGQLMGQPRGQPMGQLKVLQTNDKGEQLINPIAGTTDKPHEIKGSDGFREVSGTSNGTTNWTTDKPYEINVCEGFLASNGTTNGTTNGATNEQFIADPIAGTTDKPHEIKGSDGFREVSGTSNGTTNVTTDKPYEIKVCEGFLASNGTTNGTTNGATNGATNEQFIADPIAGTTDKPHEIKGSDGLRDVSGTSNGTTNGTTDKPYEINVCEGFFKSNGTTNGTTCRVTDEHYPESAGGTTQRTTKGQISDTELAKSGTTDKPHDINVYEDFSESNRTTNGTTKGTTEVRPRVQLNNKDNKDNKDIYIPLKTISAELSAGAETPRSSSRGGRSSDSPIISAETKNGSASPSPVITLTLNDKTEYPITEEQCQYWAGLYPAVNVIQQLRSMKGWLYANPKKRKTKRGILKFVNTWLESHQNNGVGGQAYNKNDNNLSVIPEGYRKGYNFSSQMWECLEKWVSHKVGKRDPYTKEGLEELLKKASEFISQQSENALLEMISRNIANNSSFAFDKIYQNGNGGYNGNGRTDQHRGDTEISEEIRMQYARIPIIEA